MHDVSDKPGTGLVAAFQRTNPLGWVTLGLIGGTFLLDVQVPLGVAVWVFYFPAIVTALFWRGRPAMLVATLAVVALASAGFWLSPPGNRSAALLNRPLFVLSCVVFAGFCWWIDKTRRALAVLQAEQQNEEQFRRLFDNTAAGMCILDLEERYVRINHTYCALLGYREQDLAGHRFLDMVHREDVAGHRACWEQLGCREEFQYTLEHRAIRADGGMLWVKTTVNASARFGTRQPLVIAIVEDITERKRAEQALVASHAELDRRVIERTAALTREMAARERMERQIRRHAAELEDRVAERAARIQELEAQRAQTEKLAALGQLAAGVAHEINNPIAGIKHAFQLVKQAIPDGHRHYEFVGMIDREIARVASIVKQMYQLYRPAPPRAQALDLAAVIHDVADLVGHRLARRHVTLRVEPCPVMPSLWVPQGPLLQILLNLLHNAIDCSADHAVIVLTVRTESETVRIGVRDWGPGIPADVLPRLFEPFFTTKHDGEQKGMGLGLSVSHNLAHAIGGRIEVQTVLREGSTFTLVLPISCAPGEPDQTPLDPEEVLNHGR